MEKVDKRGTERVSRRRASVRKRRDLSRKSKEGQEKVSAEVGGAPEQLVAIPPDVSPSGDYRRDALSHRRQSAT